MQLTYPSSQKTQSSNKEFLVLDENQRSLRFLLTVKRKEINLSELSIEEAFSVSTFSRGPILNSKNPILIPKKQNGFTALNNHAPLPSGQRRQRNHRHPVTRGGRFLGHGDLGGFAGDFPGRGQRRSQKGAVKGGFEKGQRGGARSGDGVDPAECGGKMGSEISGIEGHWKVEVEEKWRGRVMVREEAGEEREREKKEDFPLTTT